MYMTSDQKTLANSSKNLGTKLGEDLFKKGHKANKEQISLIIDRLIRSRDPLAISSFADVWAEAAKDLQSADLDLISLDRVSKLLGRTPKTIWVWWSKDGKFPKPLLDHNNRCIGWRKKALLDWINNLEAQS